MKPTVLIAVNFAREQRVALMVFVSWLVALVVIVKTVGPHATPDDMQALFQQQAVYGMVYCLIVALSAVPKERSSRKIIAVLSKGISRGQYIRGIILGHALLMTIYLACLGAIYLGFFSVHAQVAVSSLLLAVWLAAMLACSIAVFFTTFLHPAIASVGTGLVLGSPILLEWKLGRNWGITIPVYYVARQVFRFTFAEGWAGGWLFAVIALVEILGFVVLATWIFSRQDVTLTID